MSDDLVYAPALAGQVSFPHQQQLKQQRQRGWQQLLQLPANEGAMNNAVGAISAVCISPSTPASSSNSSTCSPGTPSADTPLPTAAVRLCTCGNCRDTTQSWLQHQLEQQQRIGAAAAATAATGESGASDAGGSISSATHDAAAAAVPLPAFVLLGLL